MLSFPAELHSYILSLACVDDGSTYRSLSSVSHYFRSLALPYRYQSISLTSQAQIHDVSKALSVLPGHLRRIKHIFVSDVSPTGKGSKPATYDLAQTEILYVLQLAASTLESLEFNASSSPFSSTSLIANIFAIPMPSLLHLSVVGFYPFPHPSLPSSSSSSPSHSSTTTETTPTMPRLRSLHLAGNRNPVGLFQTGNLDEACPKLRELRISGLSQAVTFAIDLEAAVTAACNDDDSVDTPSTALFPVRLPSQLERIELRAVPLSPRISPTSTTALKDKEMRRIFDKLQSPGTDATRVPTVHVLPDVS